MNKILGLLCQAKLRNASQSGVIVVGYNTITAMTPRAVTEPMMSSHLKTLDLSLDAASPVKVAALLPVPVAALIVDDS